MEPKTEQQSHASPTNDTKSKWELLAWVVDLLFGTKGEQTFDPALGFTDLRIVRSTLTFVLLGAVCLGAWVIYQSDHLVLSPTYEGVNYLVTNVLRVPLGMLAALIPVMALFAASHRSHQTKAQIDSNNSQNLFANAFTHKKQFEEEVERLIREEELGEILSIRTSVLHDQLFPKVGDGFYKIESVGILSLGANLAEHFEAAVENELPDSGFGIVEELYDLFRRIGVDLSSEIKVIDDSTEDVQVVTFKGETLIDEFEMLNRVWFFLIRLYSNFIGPGLTVSDVPSRLFYQNQVSSLVYQCRSLGWKTRMRSVEGYVDFS